MPNEINGPGPSDEQRKFQMDTLKPQTLEGFLSSPDHFVLSAGRSPIETLPSDVSIQLLTSGVIERIPEGAKSDERNPSAGPIAVSIPEISTYLKEHTSDQPDIIVHVLKLIDGQLGEFYSPHERYDRIRSITTSIAESQENGIDPQDLLNQKKVISEALTESVTTYPRQLMAVTHLFQNSDFKTAAETYMTSDRAKEQRGIETTETYGDAFFTLQQKITNRIDIQREQIIDFVKTPHGEEELHDGGGARIIDELHTIPNAQSLELVTDPKTKDVAVKSDRDTREQFYISPDHIVFNPGHTEDLEELFPELRQTGTALTVNDEVQLAVDTNVLANLLREKGNMNKELLPDVLKIVAQELRQFYDPQTYIPRLHKEAAKTVDEKKAPESLRQSWVDHISAAYTTYPGRIASMKNLLTDDAFKKAVENYKLVYGDEMNVSSQRDMGLTNAQSLDKEMGIIHEMIQFQEKQVDTATLSPEERVFLTQQGVVLPIEEN